MKVFCIHCGKPIDLPDDSASKQARCRACGKATLVPGGGGAKGPPADGPTENRSTGKSRTKDVVIVILVLLVLALLAGLLFRPESGARRLVFGDLGAQSPAAKEGGAVPTERSSAGADAASPNSGFVGNQASGGSAGSGGEGSLAPPSGPGAGLSDGKTIASETPDNSGLKKEDDAKPEVAAANGGLTPAATPDGKSPPATAGGGGSAAPNVASVDPSKPDAGSVSPISPPAGVADPGQSPISPSSAPTAPRDSHEPAPTTAPPPNQTTTPSRANATPPANSPLSAPDRPVAPATPSQPAAPPLQVAKDTTAALLGDATPASPAAGETKPPAPPGTDAASQKPPPPTDAKTPGNPTGAGDGAGGGKKEEPPPEPKAFDPLAGTNVMFVLDRSLSMRGEKSVRARQELVNTLNKLGPGKSFYVMFFPEAAMPTGGPLPATPQNIRSITNWLFSLGHAYGSDPTKAVEKGLALKPDTLWLLSDGEFSAAVPAAIHTANVSAKTHIHTVGLYDGKGEKTMRQISGENGGTYRFVPPPGTGAKTPAGAAPK